MAWKTISDLGLSIPPASSLDAGRDPIFQEYAAHAERFTQHALQGGVTLPSSTAAIREGAEPFPVGDAIPKGQEWFGVGGGEDYRESDRPKIPEKAILGPQFTPGVAVQHLIDVEENIKAGNTLVHAGGWVEGNNVVLDHSTVHPTEEEGIAAAQDREEREYFDAKEVESKKTPPRTSSR